MRLNKIVEFDINPTDKKAILDALKHHNSGGQKPKLEFFDNDSKVRFSTRRDL